MSDAPTSFSLLFANLFLFQGGYLLKWAKGALMVQDAGTP